MEKRKKFWRKIEGLILKMRKFVIKTVQRRIFSRVLAKIAIIKQTSITNRQISEILVNFYEPNVELEKSSKLELKFFEIQN